MYQVVFRTIDRGSHYGVITRSTYASKESFDESRTKRMLDGTNRLVTEVYEVVKEGVTDEEGERLCSSREARSAATKATILETNEMLLSMRNDPDITVEEINEFAEMQANYAVMVASL